MPITPDQLTALIQANDLPAIRAALDAQPELLEMPESALGWTPLHWAVCHGCNGRGDHLRGVVDLLLEYMDSVDLHAAALLDRPDLAAAAIESGAVVDAVDEHGRTPLHVAAERGSRAVAEVLLDHGADPNARPEGGDTALALAAHPGPLKPAEARDVVDLLCARGATVDLHTAAMIGETERLAMLLDTEPGSIDALDDGGCTALFHAAHNLRLAAVDLLLTRGADVNLVRPDGQTPLSTAVDHSWDEGGPEVVARLLKAKPTVDLFSAAQLGLTDRVVELLDADPSLLEGDRYGYSCLFLAAGAGHAETIAVLLRYGADPNQKDPYHGSTALHQAAAWGRWEATRALLEGGADRTLTNKAGQTPAEVARGRGWDKVAELIEGWG